MTDIVLGERRRETRRAPGPHDPALEPQVPGARVLEVVDVSRHGLRCRLAQPVRPGRSMPLRMPGGSAFAATHAMVIRCSVVRVTRHGLQYDAAWLFDKAWLAE